MFTISNIVIPVIFLQVLCQPTEHLTASLDGHQTQKAHVAHVPETLAFLFKVHSSLGC